MTAGWSYKKIGDICKTAAGGTPLKSNRSFYDGGEIPWLLSGEVGRRSIDSARQYITGKGLEGSSAKIFPVNTVLVAMYGATAGQTGVLRFEASTNQAVCGIYPSETMYHEFIYYSILYKQDELVASATGNAQPNISQAKIRNTEIPIPPWPEQKRIVAILDEAFEGIDTAIANTEKNLANTRELFESYLSSVFDDFPVEWVVAKLSDICSIKHGFAFKSEFFTTEGPYVVLTPGSFYEKGGFRDQGLKTKYYFGDVPDGYTLRKGDFLFAMTEQAVGLLGSSLVVPQSGRYLHNQRLGLVQVRDGVEWCNDFFFHQFNTSSFRAAVQRTAAGAKVRHTSPIKLGEIMIKYPLMKLEQERVAIKLNELSDEIQRLESVYQQKLAALIDLKQSLLQKAFSGELTAGLAEVELACHDEVSA